MNYSIKQIAEKTNLKPHVLRYYEKEGLLPDVTRSESGIRKYSESDLEWLSLICCLKNTGMTIKQIREFVKLSLQGQETLKERCSMLIQHKKQVEDQIQEMQKYLWKVDHKIQYFTEQLAIHTSEIRPDEENGEKQYGSD
ncbi:MerR family transcriptional regulator [Clostridium sp. E02]|uniref:MerR family transcriptional regulator n=1 Tax=Clostridium sp. E02 TaxID=2487134 RepID=UPI000F5218CD|nr:MerR family transcriptional regulator [Clostridium sp. E02]